jgi:hypothetical protein
MDGEFKPAREAKVGSILSRGHVVESIMESEEGRILNPITRSGTILAMEEGYLVLAARKKNGSRISCSPSTQSIFFRLLLSGQHVPYVGPAQTCYDAVLEPFFDNTVSMLASTKKHVPTWLVFAVISFW